MNSRKNIEPKSLALTWEPSISSLSTHRFSIKPVLQKLLLAMLLLCATAPSALAQPFGIFHEARYTNNNPIAGCTQFQIEYTVKNEINEDMVDVSLDLFVLPVFMTVTDPGQFSFVTSNFSFTINGNTNVVADRWSITGLTIPAGETRKFLFGVSISQFITGTAPAYFRTCTNTVVCSPFREVIGNFFPSPALVLADVGETKRISQLIGNVLSTGTATSGQYLLKGILIADTDYEFFANNFLLGHPDAKIIVESGHLKFTNEHVYGCEQAWKGITVEAGATLTITGGSQATSIFEDAEVGVTAKNGSTVNATNTRFINNKTGIKVPALGGTNNVGFNVGYNSFEVDKLKKPLSGNGFAGLDLRNLNVAVVTSNTYKKMDYGIYGISSNLFTSYDEFGNLNNVGIRMVGNGHLLYQVGKGKTLATPTFHNVPTGVVTFGMNVTSFSNGMRSVNSGYRSLSLNNREAFITGNAISAKNDGILVSGLRPLTRSSISDNTITMDQNPNGRGINSINSSKGGATWLRMNGNIIDVMDATYGIDMLNNNEVETSGNVVTLMNPQEGYGIAVGGGGSNDLLGNFLNAAGSYNLQYGIAVGQSGNGEYGCNHFNGTRTGLWFSGPNDFSDIKGNDFNGFLHGLQIGNLAAPGSQNQGGFTGRQSHRGNTWSTAAAATGWGAIHYSQIPNEVSESQHEVDVNDGASYITTQRTYAEIIPGQPMPFFDPESGDTYTCPSNLQGSIGNTALGTIAYGIASGTITVGTSAGENWTAKRQLYRHLKENPSLAPQGSVYATYLSNEAISTVGKFEDLQSAIDAMLAGDANARQQLGNYAASMETKFGEMKMIMDGLSTQPNDPNLLAQRDAKRVEIANVSAQLQSVEQSMQSARVSAANQLLANNAAIVANATHEANQKTANRVRLEVIANGQAELTQQQVADLTPIAVQCPYTGGEGVYAARAILGNEVVYNDFTACGMSTGGGQQIKSPDEGGPTLPMFTIYPNPASDYIAIQLLDKLEGDASFVLTNVLGVQVRKETLSKGSNSAIMFTDGLTAGTYYLTLRSGTGVRSQVLLIAK